MITNGVGGAIRQAIATMVLLVLLSHQGLAGDWPQYRGPERDAKSTDEKLLKKWPDGGPKLLFTKTGIGSGYSQAIVAGGMIYVTGGVEGKGFVSAFDLDGKPKWKESYGPVFPGAKRGRYAGARSAPTVHDGKLYVAGSGGELVCLDAKTGKRAWSVDFFKAYGISQARWGYSESVLVEGRNVLLTTGGDTLMVAFDKDSGKVAWKTEGIGDASSYCSPMILTHGGTRQVVTISHSFVVSIDPKDGKLIWKHPFAGGKRANNATTPVYADGRLFCSAGYGKGSEILEFAENGKGVKLMHTLKVPDNHHGNLVLVDGLVFGTGHNNGGQWVCVELATGEIKWQDAGIGKGSVSFADGLMYCYAERDGVVGLVKPSAEGFEKISSFTVPAGEGEHWAHPTIAGGRLYIRHGDALMAYDVRSK